jgi:glycerol-3-phosphate acyltransferase PlsY
VPDPLGGLEYTWRLWALAPFVGYLAGAIPFGLILTRLAGHGDLRAIGSGNIGATNVLRTGNTAMAALTLALDAAKGGVPVWLAGMWYGQDFAVMTGLGAVVGHAFPIWLRLDGVRAAAAGFAMLAVVGVGFGLLTAGGLNWTSAAGLALIVAAGAFAWGGKAVATTLGCLIAIAWPVGVAACAVWLALAALFRISSAAALGALIAAPVLAHFLADLQRTEFAVFLAAFILVRHHPNLRRLVRGEEPKIAFGADSRV